MSLFTPYFKDSISVQNYIGVNDFGDSQYSSATDMLCRVEYKTQETLDSKGNKVISTATIYSDEVIPPLSIVFVNDTKYTVKSCSPITNLMGKLDHYEIIL